LSPGEVKFERLVEVLKKAEKYIFLEYFSISDGSFWSAVLEILKEKAANGVDVRIIYDDVGCFLLLPRNYPGKLADMGIKCVIFNPFRPIITAKQNNRDHRKIAVVDGKFAITGGINLSDEYINACKKYGHWKDAAVLVEGEAAWSFTLMFLQMWNVCTKIKEDYLHFYPWETEECLIPDDGFVQPYADSPLDPERVGEHVYLQIIYNSKKYLYINTPYLIIDDSMMTALALAAKSGVDVRIITPHYPDKPYVHMITRSNYRELVSAGVKIYEYTDGFIHAKTFISDGKIATVGTTNLDYRSLYLSFECGVSMYESKAVTEIYEDFMNTLVKCHQILEQDCKSNRLMRLLQNVLRLLSPLL
jgi:cardiolipin synthase